MIRTLLTCWRVALALCAGVLPRRWWVDLDRTVPVTRTAPFSAIATLVAGFAVGLPAYLRFAEGQARFATTLMLQSTGWQAVPGNGPLPSEATARAAWFVTFLSPLAFVIGTPLGLLSAYLVCSGALRAVSAAAGDARGDPLLSLLDAAHVHRRRARVWAQQRAEREALEGREVPDRLVAGRTVGHPAADYVVVASRQKAAWDTGTVLITGDGWFRVGVAVDRSTPAGLRTLYPLTRLTESEVARRTVHYDLPAKPAERPADATHE